jgi:hypothetical protein
MIYYFLLYIGLFVSDTMKQLAFGVHLPVMGFKGWNRENEKPHTREQMLSIARLIPALTFDFLFRENTTPVLRFVMKQDRHRYPPPISLFFTQFGVPYFDSVV